MVNSDIIVDRPCPVLARAPYFPRIQHSNARYSLRTLSCQRFSRTITQCIAFRFISLRTLSTLLYPKIPRKPIRIKRLRTLAKTTEGCHSRTFQHFNLESMLKPAHDG